MYILSVRLQFKEVQSLRLMKNYWQRKHGVVAHRSSLRHSSCSFGLRSAFECVRCRHRHRLSWAVGFSFAVYFKEKYSTKSYWSNEIYVNYYCAYTLILFVWAKPYMRYQRIQHTLSIKMCRWAILVLFCFILFYVFSLLDPHVHRKLLQFCTHRMRLPFSSFAKSNKAMNTHERICKSSATGMEWKSFFFMEIALTICVRHYGAACARTWQIEDKRQSINKSEFNVFAIIIITIFNGFIIHYLAFKLIIIHTKLSLQWLSLSLRINNSSWNERKRNDRMSLSVDGFT